MSSTRPQTKEHHKQTGPRRRTGTLVWLIGFVVAFVAPWPGNILSGLGSLCVVRGRIDIRNAKVKVADGSADAGGVVVWLTPLKGGPQPNITQGRPTLEQRDKRFVPHVMAVQVGTEVDFPNRDPFFHNVFSTFNGKRFDLGLYASGESRPVLFSRPGVSYIFCNIHPQMSAYVVAVETPFFAVSATNGNYSIENVPAGEYRIHVWHERSDEKQLLAQSRVVRIDSMNNGLDVIRLDESGYVATTHKNKHGEDYDAEHTAPDYRRP